MLFAKKTPGGYYGSCPRCGTDIPQRGYITGFAICNCGWFDRTPNVRATIETERKSSLALIAAAIIMVAGFAHLSNWGEYAISAPLQEIGQMTGTLSSQGYHDLAKACLDLGKISCAQTALINDFRSTNDLTALSGLGHLQIRLGQDMATAQQTLEAYFQAGGKEAEPYLDYGRLLEASSKYDEAIKAYQSSIAASGQTLPVAATTALVHTLMKIGRFEEAYNVVTQFYASAGNAKGYLNTEHAQLEEYMNQQAAKAHGKAKHVASR